MNINPDLPIKPALTPAQTADVRQRAEALHGVTPTMTVDGFLWLHAAIFVGIDGSAGQLRKHEAGFAGFHFARPDLILPCLQDRFAELVATDGFKTDDATIFCKSLAHHLSELHAIAPFSIGNRRTIATHCEQLAHAVGHPLNLCAAQKPDWDQALYGAFVHQEVDEVAALLSPAPVSNDATGIIGTARLPNRFLPRGRRQFIYLPAIKQALDDHRPAARAQLHQQEADLLSRNAPSDHIDAVRRELSYLDHPKGAEFQLGLLGALGERRIEVNLRPGMSARERVREIAYGLMIALDALPRESVLAAGWKWRRPHYAGRGSPHQARMADQFLRNNAALNRSDPRFAAAQRLVDQAGESAAQIRGRDPAAMEKTAATMRRHIADQIRSGALEISGKGKAASYRAL